MSMVIKASAANGSIRPFVPPSLLNGNLAAAEPEPEGPLETLAEPSGPVVDEEKEALTLELAELRETLSAVKDVALKAEARAREEGRKEALENALEAEAERQTMLETGIGQLGQDWNKRLEELDVLALLIARSALSKLFESWDDASEFVARTMARQVRLLRRETILAVRVSADDFPDEQAITALAAKAGTGSVRLVADPDLKAGECRADLQLGHVDLGVSTQRAQLLTLLDSLAGQGDAS